MPPDRAPSPLVARFGERVRELRQETGLSQMEFARQRGFDATHLGFIEVGRRSPTLDTLGKLARAFNMTISNWWKVSTDRSNGEPMSQRSSTGRSRPTPH